MRLFLTCRLGSPAGSSSQSVPNSLVLADFSEGKSNIRGSAFTGSNPKRWHRTSSLNVCLLMAWSGEILIA